MKLGQVLGFIEGSVCKELLVDEEDNGRQEEMSSSEEETAKGR